MVQGMVRPRPAMASSRTEPTRYMTQPIAMKSAPLMRAWLNRWRMPAVTPSTDARLMPRTM